MHCRLQFLDATSESSSHRGAREGSPTAPHGSTAWHRTSQERAAEPESSQNCNPNDSAFRHTLAAAPHSSSTCQLCLDGLADVSICVCPRWAGRGGTGRGGERRGGDSPQDGHNTVEGRRDVGEIEAGELARGVRHGKDHGVGLPLQPVLDVQLPATPAAVAAMREPPPAPPSVPPVPSHARTGRGQGQMRISAPAAGLQASTGTLLASQQR